MCRVAGVRKPACRRTLPASSDFGYQAEEHVGALPEEVVAPLPTLRYCSTMFTAKTLKKTKSEK